MPSTVKTFGHPAYIHAKQQRHQRANQLATNPPTELAAVHHLHTKIPVGRNSENTV